MGDGARLITCKVRENPYSFRVFFGVSNRCDDIRFIYDCSCDVSVEVFMCNEKYNKIGPCGPELIWHC